MSDVAAWIAFGVTLAICLAIDLIAHRGHRGTSRKSALAWSGVWIAVGLGFTAIVYFAFGSGGAHEYVAAYLLEKSLSLDNMFVFLLIFRSLRIERENQRTALSWGIFGALVFRAIFVIAGVAALERWSWVSWVFGGILIVAAIKAFREDPESEEESSLARWLSRHLPISRTHDHEHFLVKENGRWVATPLLLALVAVELSDILFAVDSVPAALSVSRSRFIVYASNAFAILGLRSLYLALAAYLKRMRYLHYGLAAVLALAGIKLVVADWVHVHPLISVLAIALCIGCAVAASLLKRNGEAALDEPSVSKPT